MTPAALLLAPLLVLGADPVRDLATALGARTAAAEAAGAKVGFEIRSLDTGEVLAGHRAGTPLAAASNTKLVTTAAALTLLAPGFQFETAFSTRGEVRGGSLRGDLGVKGGGDPCLSPRFFEEDFARIFSPVVEALRGKGISKIEGDLVLDVRLFDRQFVHPSWPRDQLNQSYAAPVCALSLNEGCIEAKVSPGRSGGPASLAVIPGGAPWTVEGRIGTSPGKGKTVVHLAFADGALKVRGEISSGSRPYTAKVPVPDPPRFFGAVLKEALREAGIEVGGAVREAEADGKEWETLVTMRSPLLPLVAVVNKRSDNFGAEHLLKTIGARLEGEGSFAAGVRAARGFLASRGVPLEGFSMEDGSGLSRNDRFSPSFFGALLEAMWRSERRQEFLGTLASPGEDGTTLERRLKEEDLPGRVRAKTGYLAGVRALSGYARTKGGENLAFSILVNEEGNGGNKLARELPDDLVRLLASFSRGGG
ncbi:MAG: D-alanyl-D-alanine carboxypeptidase/D-alanyl-D-alanine-endopeptidase [Planctomycetes bacterium]|nr:D-alanyl-D-alanine carboxypeptidase/D-alanyl-D-alanine-endopeptidase [Planctomycetota bacterium]